MPRTAVLETSISPLHPHRRGAPRESLAHRSGAVAHARLPALPEPLCSVPKTYITALFLPAHVDPETHTDHVSELEG